MEVDPDHTHWIVIEFAKWELVRYTTQVGNLLYV
jgi:hypothetical protein